MLDALPNGKVPILCLVTIDKLYSLCGRSNTIYHGKLTFASEVHPGCLFPAMRRGFLLRDFRGPIPQAEMHSLWLQKDPLVRRDKCMKDPRTEFNYSGTRTQFIKKRRKKPQTTFPKGQSPPQECLIRVILWDWWAIQIKFLIYCPLLKQILLGLDLPYGTWK